MLGAASGMLASDFCDSLEATSSLLTSGKDPGLSGSTRHRVGPFFCPGGETEAQDTQPKSRAKTASLPWPLSHAALLQSWPRQRLPLRLALGTHRSVFSGSTPLFILPGIQPFGLWNLARCVTLDKAVNLRKPQFPAFSKVTCSRWVMVRSPGGSLCPELTSELGTSTVSLAVGLFLPPVCGGRDPGLPCPLSPASISSRPLLGRATSHQHF